MTSHDKLMTQQREDAPVWTNARRGAFGQLSAATLAGRAIVALVGATGIGKATMLRDWRQQCGPKAQVFWMPGATGDDAQDLAALASAFGVSDSADVLPDLRAILQKSAGDDNTNFLVVEDAHNLAVSVLEDLADLTQGTITSEPVLQLVLSGDATLYDILEDPTAFPDADIVDVPGLTATATGVLFKRDLAGSVTVKDSVVASVHDLTGGVPGQIVALADAVRAQAGETPSILGDGEFAKIVEGFQAKPDEAPARELPPDVNDPSKLPNSIQGSENPRHMLRWAFGLEGEEEDADDGDDGSATLSLPPSRHQPADVGELQQALAEIAKRESAEMGTTRDIDLAPELPFSGAVDPKQFRHGAEGLAGIVGRDRRMAAPVSEEALAQGPPMSAPDDLKTRVLTEEEPPSKSGRKILAVGGLAAVFAAGAFGWPLIEQYVLNQPVGGAPAEITNAAAVLPAGPSGIFVDPVVTFEPDPQLVFGAPLANPVLRSAAPLTSNESGPQVQIASANPFQVEEQTRTASILGAEQRRQALTEQADSAANRLNDIEAQIAKSETRLAALAAREDLVLSDLATLQNEQRALTAELADERDTLVTLADERDAVSVDVAELQTRRDDLASDLTALQSQLDTRQAALSQQQTALNVARVEQGAVTELAGTRDGLQAEVAALRAEAAEVQAAISKMASDEAAAARSLADLVAERDGLVTDVAALTAQLSETRQALTDQERGLAAMQADAATAREQVAAATAEVAALNAERDTRLEERDALQGELTDLAARAAAAQDQIAAAQDELAAQTAKVSTAQAELTRITASAETETARLATVEAAVQAADARRQEADAAVAEAQDQVAALAAEQDRRGQLLSNVEASEATLKDIEARKFAATAELAAAQDRLQSEQAKLNAVRADADQASSTLDELRQSVAALTVTQGKLAEAVDQATTEEARILAQRDQLLAEIDDAKASKDVAEIDLVSAQAAQSQALAQLDAAKQQSETASAEVTALSRQRNALQADVDVLTARLNEDTARRTQALTTIAQTRSEWRAVAQQLAENQAAMTELDARKLDAEQSIAALTQQAAGLSAELEQLQQARDVTLNDLTVDRDRLTALRANVATLEEVAAATETSIEARLTELTAAEQTLASLQARVLDAAPKPVPLPAAGLEARGAALVDDALLTAPGLDALTDAQADALRTALVEGYCVADALKATTGRANPFTVRALRRLIGACNN